MIKHLDKKFIKKGIKYAQIASSGSGYVYFCTSTGSKGYYEVFKHVLTPICINFEKREYSKTDFKVRYPGNEEFGSWAWTLLSREKAIRKFEGL